MMNLSNKVYYLCLLGVIVINFQNCGETFSASLSSESPDHDAFVVALDNEDIQQAQIDEALSEVELTSPSTDIHLLTYLALDLEDPRTLKRKVLTDRAITYNSSTYTAGQVGFGTRDNTSCRKGSLFIARIYVVPMGDRKSCGSKMQKNSSGFCSVAYRGLCNSTVGFFHTSRDIVDDQNRTHEVHAFSYLKPEIPTSSSNSLPVGNIDIVNQQTGQIAGWNADPDSPNRYIQIQIKANGHIVHNFLATQYRLDVDQKTPYGGHHGYSITINSAYRDGVVRAYELIAFDANTGQGKSFGKSTFAFDKAP